jgi:acyl-coenzyme A thioesterase PaaI-like protein
LLKAAIRGRVLQALALNREPGFHFAGNLAQLSFEHTTSEESRVVLDAGPHAVDGDGQLNLGLVAMLADMSLAATIRAKVHPATRLATVSLAMQLTGTRLTGPLASVARFQGFLGSGDTRQALASARLEGPGGVVAIAHGAFIPLGTPPGVTAFPLPRNPREASALTEDDLRADERAVLKAADDALAAGERDFIGHFLGYRPRRTRTGACATMRNGAHVANRVGHVQGGLLMGLAATTAMAALPAGWGLSGIHAVFVSPGQGKAIRAAAKLVHHGSMTGVARTELKGPDGRRVLEATTTHWRR